jgi:transposase
LIYRLAKILEIKIFPSARRLKKLLRGFPQGELLWIKPVSFPMAIATRYAKNSASFLASDHIHCIVIWLKIY